MKLSVLVPVYNVAPYLRECLDSILAGSCADIECVCVDDGATDGSAAILDDYARRDARLHVVHQKNSGVSSARNAALVAMTGDWFAFVDGDDWVDVGIMLRLIAKADAEGYDGVFVGKKELMDFYGCVCNKFYRADKFKQLRFVEGMRFREDFCFWVDAYWCIRSRWLRVEENYYHYRSREGSATNSVTPRAYHDLLYCYVYALSRMRERGVVFKRLSNGQVSWFRTRVSGAAHFALNRWGKLSMAERNDAQQLIEEISHLAGIVLHDGWASVMLMGRKLPGWVYGWNILWRAHSKFKRLIER